MPSASEWGHSTRCVTHGNFAYSNLNEGYGKVLRYGAYAPEVLDKLRWMNKVMGPILGAALTASGEGLDIRALLAESLHMGDEGHNRNKAGSILYTAKLAPWIVQVAPDAATAAAVLKFLGDNALSVLNPVMAACKAMADAGHGVEGSTIMPRWRATAPTWASASLAWVTAGLPGRPACPTASTSPVLLPLTPTRTLATAP